MKDYIQHRVLKHARLFIERDATIRSVAEKTGWSKQTVHNDLVKKLTQLHEDLSDKVNSKLNENKYIGQIKGGYKTQEKWLKRKEKRNKNVADGGNSELTSKSNNQPVCENGIGPYSYQEFIRKGE